jgi:hypothetical protein
MQKILKSKEKYFFKLVIFLIAFIILVLKFGFRVLNPVYFDWLMLGYDTATEFLSWEYFRQSAWQFPIIGTMEGYAHPTVTGVGMTGAIPLLAYPFKLLRGVLPIHFQYFGWWFLMCYALQGWLSFRLFLDAKVTENKLLALIGAIFFMLSPPLLHRAGHINLCSHWLLIGLVWIYFDRVSQTATLLIRTTFFVFLAAMIHQYMTAMVLGAAFAVYAQLWYKKRINGIKFLLFNALNFLLVLFLFYLNGNFLMKMEAFQNVGFSRYSANLNTFYNSQGFSSWFSARPLFVPEQYEGFAYMGVSVLFLIILSFLIALYKRFNTKIFEAETEDKKNKIWKFPIIFVAWLTFMFSLSPTVGWGDKRVLLYDLSWIEFWANAFRSSGRFVWLSFYLILFAVLAYLFENQRFIEKKLTNFYKTALLSIWAILLIIQFLDIRPLFNAHFVGDWQPYIHLAFWEKAVSEADILVMYPMYGFDYQHRLDYTNFGLVAAPCNKPITTGYFARMNINDLWKVAATLDRALERGELGAYSRALFVVQPKAEMVKRFDLVLQKGLVKKFEKEGYIVFVPTALVSTNQLFENNH